MKKSLSFIAVIFVLAVGNALADESNGNGRAEYAEESSQPDQESMKRNEQLTQARAVPNFENGKPAGYKMIEVKPGGIYDKLGLKNGDVIQSVDGRKIDDPQKTFQLIGKLKQGAQLEVSRDGADEAIKGGEQ